MSLHRRRHKTFSAVVKRWMMVIGIAGVLGGCAEAPTQQIDPALEAALMNDIAAIDRLGTPEGQAAALGDFRCTVASVTDGDTFRCAELGGDGRQIRVRLSGVSARERDGSCSPGHPCPKATAEAASAALEEMALGQTLTCRKVGRTYGRRAAFCRLPGGEDLSCAMVDSRTVERWARYWGDHSC